MNEKGQIGIYFHWPFCLSKCPYCDFNVHVVQKGSVNHARWCAAYLKSLEHYRELVGARVVASLFFGGGTPSLMPPDMLLAIIDKVHALWPCANNLEITLEANPTSVEAEKFQAFRDAGINRVSIGVQALNDADLAFLGRKHSFSEAMEAIETADKIFDRFSFDLIYARPNQSLGDWEGELMRAVALAKGHLSLYQLTIERNTPFYFDHAQKKFSLPKEELAANFYDLTQDVLMAQGLPAYEVSNHASAGQESVHNLIYWNYGDYIGIGPGAHGRLTLNGARYASREHHAPQSWLARVEAQGCGAHPFEALDEEAQFLERLMMGLRLNAGIAKPPEWARYIDAEKCGVAVEQGWVIESDEDVRLSREGMLRLNALIPFILKRERS